MTQNRYYSSVAQPTTLAVAAGSSGQIEVQSITGLPSSYPYTMLIDWGLSTQEAVSVTAAWTGSGPYTSVSITRGIDGTTAQAHSSGAVVVHGVSAQDYNEAQLHIQGFTSGTSGTGNAQIHGLANGSSVVGTTDAQTLSNKTLTGATVSGGDVTISNSDASNPILTVTNTHSTPASAITRIVANAAGDSSLGVRVSGDTVNRVQVDSNGKHQWGPGGSTAVDTDLYRSATGVLSTDNTLTATTGVQVGSATVALGGGSGVLGISNATTAPTSNPSGGGVIYAQSGGLLVRDSGGGIASMHSDPSTQSVYVSGATVLGMTIPQYAVASATLVAPTSNTGTLYMTSIWLPAGLKLTNANWVTGTTAGATMTHWWLGIADSGGVQRAHCTDQTSTAIAASSLITKAFASTYTTTYSGTYWLLLSVTATTAPTSSGVVTPATPGVPAVISGASSTASTSSPGTDGTTTYSLPTTQGPVPMMYLT